MKVLLNNNKEVEVEKIVYRNYRVFSSWVVHLKKKIKKVRLINETGIII